MAGRPAAGRRPKAVVLVYVGFCTCTYVARAACRHSLSLCTPPLAPAVVADCHVQRHLHGWQAMHAGLGGGVLMGIRAGIGVRG